MTGTKDVAVTLRVEVAVTDVVLREMLGARQEQALDTTVGPNAETTALMALLRNIWTGPRATVVVLVTVVVVRGVVVPTVVSGNTVVTVVIG